MISKKAIDLILQLEGVDQPWKWPGGESGITIGYGYDLGYEENFRRDWDGHLTSAQIDHLSGALGKKGGAAHAIAGRYRDITIPEEAARNVFMGQTLPVICRQTEITFPGLDALPPDVQGALVSLVYNRGEKMDGSRRVEMRAIRAAVKAGDAEVIAEQLRVMKRLWVGTDIASAMTNRREAEAKLVEGAMVAAA